MRSRTGETRTILIVDDEDRLRRALERSLCQEDWQTQAAASGEEALGILRREHVDLVITDLVMPGMDGMSLVRQIKSAGPGTEVIILTAYGSPESMEEAETLGVGSYLAKPFDLAFLKSRVNDLLPASEASVASCSRPGSWAAPRVLRILGSASGKTVAVIIALPRQTFHCIRPRNVMLNAGKLVGAAIGLCFGTHGLASVFKKTRCRIMRHLIVGLILLALGAWGIIVWWEDFGEFLRGLIPLLLALVGLAAIGSGFQKTMRETQQEDESLE